MTYSWLKNIFSSKQSNSSRIPSVSGTEPLLELRSVSFRHPANDGLLFEDLNLEVLPNDRIAIIADTGTGKSTLLDILAGILPPLSGELLFHGKPVQTPKDIRNLRQSIGYIVQNPEEQLFGDTVLNAVITTPMLHGFSQKWSSISAQKVIEQCGLEHLSNAKVEDLSGGERKLVAIASVLACTPRILVCDEPSVHLSAVAQSTLQQVLTENVEALVIASSDIGFFKPIVEEAYTIEQKKLLMLA